MSSRTVTLVLDSTHCRAICDEIGARLHDVLRTDVSELPPRLQALLDKLARLEEGPSIVPSLDELLLPLEPGLLAPR
jgi:hypothetical protein